MKHKQIQVFMSDRMRDIVTRDCHFNDGSLSTTFHTDRPFEGVLCVHIKEKPKSFTQSQIREIYEGDGLNTNDLEELLFRMFGDDYESL